MGKQDFSYPDNLNVAPGLRIVNSGEGIASDAVAGRQEEKGGSPRLSQPIDKYYSMLYDLIVLFHECGLPHKLR
jgi:hypothetical protein